MAHQSKSFGTSRPFRSHIVQGGGMGKEVRDLRADVDEGFQNNEARASFPHLDWLDVSAGALLAAGGNITLMGRNLLQGQTFDTLSLGIGTAQLTLTLLKPGASGIKVVVVQGTVGSAALVGTTLTLTLATGGTTSDAMAILVNAACVGVVLAVGHGAGNMLVQSLTPMAGGNGVYAGNKIWVAGVEALPRHAAGLWTETSITVTVPVLTGLVAGDIVTVMVSSDGVCSEALSGVLA